MKDHMKITNVPPTKLALIAAAVCTAMLAFTNNASAARHPMPPSPASLEAPFQFFTNGPIGNPSDELNYLQTHGGGSYQPTFLPATSQFLGKFNNDGTIENGAINISQYVTITVVNGSTWNVSWNLTGSGFTMDGMLIKDGNVRLSGEIYRFYGVTPDQELVGSGTVTFDNPVRNISHITFFGSPGGQVPDGGTTVMLLGTALGALGIARRFFMG
jgi:protein with PEP-CTERM/exosortase system signal